MSEFETHPIGTAKRLGCLERRLEDLQNNPRDQYHTMEELYYYRMLYNALAVKVNALNEGSKIRATKSWRHHDGELCFGGGWFIVTIDLSTSTEQNKQITNHYKSEYWDLFQIPELPVAVPWNGHSPAEGAEALRAFLSRWQVFNRVKRPNFDTPCEVLL